MTNICSKCKGEVKYCDAWHSNMATKYALLSNKIYCMYEREVEECMHFCSKKCIPRPPIVREAKVIWKDEAP